MRLSSTHSRSRARIRDLGTCYSYQRDASIPMFEFAITLFMPSGVRQFVDLRIMMWSLCN